MPRPKKDKKQEDYIYEKLEVLKKDELLKIAKELNIKNTSKLLKKDLIEQIILIGNETKKTNVKSSKKNKLSEKNKVNSNMENIDNKDNSDDKNKESIEIYTKESLNSLTMPIIIGIAKELQIKGYSKYNKTRLIGKILEEQSLKAEQKLELPEITKLNEIIENEFKTAYGVSTPQEEGSGGSAPVPPETPEQSSEVFSNKNKIEEDSKTEIKLSDIENINQINENKTSISIENKEPINVSEFNTELEKEKLEINNVSLIDNTKTSDLEKVETISENIIEIAESTSETKEKIEQELQDENIDNNTKEKKVKKSKKNKLKEKDEEVFIQLSIEEELSKLDNANLNIQIKEEKIINDNNELNNELIVEEDLTTDILLEDENPLQLSIEEELQKLEENNNSIEPNIDIEEKDMIKEAILEIFRIALEEDSDLNFDFDKINMDDNVLFENLKQKIKEIIANKEKEFNLDGKVKTDTLVDNKIKKVLSNLIGQKELDSDSDNKVKTENLVDNKIKKVLTPAITETEKEKSFLLKPSKFDFGKPHEEYIFEDEKEINLAQLPAIEDKIVLLPVDPSKVFSYWEVSEKTSTYIAKNKIKNFIIKVNDVTGIVYNGKNALDFFTKIVPISEKNTYIELPEGNRNLCLELCIENKGELSIISRSNTIYIPREKASELVLDTFVVVNLPEIETKISDKEQEKIYVQRKFAVPPIAKKSPYFNLNDYNIAEKYNLRKMITKMPIFGTVDKIPELFAKDYKVESNITKEIKPVENIIMDIELPEKLPEEDKNIFYSPDVFIQEINDFSSKNTEPKVKNKPNLELSTFKFKSSPENKIISNQELENNKVQGNNDYEIIEYFDYDNYEELKPNDYSEYMLDNKQEFYPKELLEKIYYEIPSGESKKVYYEWVEDEIPYRKVIYWIAGEPKIHEKIYKISTGPSWIKEYVGGSERIRYLGASERFLGASEVFIGGSEYFIESSYRNLGGSEQLFSGGSEQIINLPTDHLGASELLPIGSSNKNIVKIVRRKDYQIRKFFE